MPILEVKCPCCNSILEVHSDTGKVVAHRQVKDRPDLAAFLESEKSKSSQLEQKFEARKNAQADRMRSLEEKFKQNQAKGDALPDAPKIQWD